MSLKGSLQTVALPEVLQFLSSTGKSGEFQVVGEAGEGRLWFADGRIAGFDAGSSQEAFEAIFELLRISDGEFSFAAGEVTPETGRMGSEGGDDVVPAIEAAEARFAEWRDIVAVVPSLTHRVYLLAHAPSDDLHLRRDQWSLVVAIGAGRQVSEVLGDLSLREFDGCKAVRELVDAALAEIGEPIEMVQPVAVEPEPEPVVEPEPVSGLSGWESSDPESTRASEPVADEVHVGEPVSMGIPVVSQFDAPFSGGGDADAPAIVDEGAISGALLRFGVAGGEESAPVEHDESHVGFAHLDAGEVSFSRFPTLSDPDAVEAITADALNVALADAAGARGEEPAAEADARAAEDDRYAALRAAMVEVGDNIDVEGGESDDMAAQAVHALPTYGDPVDDGRAALQALLTEVSAQSGEGDDPVDGLADRGPWTDHELAAMEAPSEWQADAEPAPSNVIPFAAPQAAEAHGQPEGFGEPASYPQPEAYGETEYGQAPYSQPEGYGQAAAYGQPDGYGQTGAYGEPGAYSPAAPEAGYGTAPVEAAEPEQPQPGEEPINRGLLLKFLSSVRN